MHLQKSHSVARRRCAYVPVAERQRSSKLRAAAHLAVGPTLARPLLACVVYRLVYRLPTEVWRGQRGASSQGEAQWRLVGGRTALSTAAGGARSCRCWLVGDRRGTPSANAVVGALPAAIMDGLGTPWGLPLRRCRREIVAASGCATRDEGTRLHAHYCRLRWPSAMSLLVLLRCGALTSGTKQRCCVPPQELSRAGTSRHDVEQSALERAVFQKQPPSGAGRAVMQPCSAATTTPTSTCCNPNSRPPDGPTADPPAALSTPAASPAPHKTPRSQMFASARLIGTRHPTDGGLLQHSTSDPQPWEEGACSTALPTHATAPNPQLSQHPLPPSTTSRTPSKPLLARIRNTPQQALPSLQPPLAHGGLPCCHP
ncbi:hypothetical protein M011DRAFT_458098 [Sporormia fimetaria CBS 119925]|uniref:Uncharacterized protein n=1 Tax=Sporormia fimetaria CBS 119925 TaxID=1340428 RepID=A0A6A6VEI0_9PLEO|nr:hypothetical protein M011DRAFT_458098 [Sporormia fimetaria CBS 119925]